jgi:hypothetical protein
VPENRSQYRAAYTEFAEPHDNHQGNVDFSGHKRTPIKKRVNRPLTTDGRRDESIRVAILPIAYMDRRVQTIRNTSTVFVSTHLASKSSPS